MSYTKKELLYAVADAYYIDYEDLGEDHLYRDNLQKICMYHGVSAWDKTREEMANAVLESLDADIEECTSADTSIYRLSKKGLKVLKEAREK